MSNKPYIFISCSALLLGIFIFLYQKEYIIFNIKSSPATVSIPAIAQKKNTSLHYWQSDQWHTEQMPLILCQNTASNIQLIISRWLQLMYDEKIIRKKATLQSALINYDQKELFISFDRAPWNKENSTFEKWMAIEGLLKTIKENDDLHTLKSIRFLIDHQPINDYHLDFTNSWPIDGFQ
jgi:hypothetical protein